MSVAADSNPPGELYCTTCEKTFEIGDRCPDDGTRLIRLKARIDPFLGRDLDGRYTILQKLGQGGMGAVYRAEQHSVGREVAVKVVNADLVAEAEVIKRFLREAKLASKLSHPNAVAVLDFGQTDDGVFYLVMELVSGRTLAQALDDEKVLRPERVVRIGAQICAALEGAHAMSIIHRDLKPSNVMLLAHGRDLVKVLDFGLAKSVSPDATSTTMTGTGAIIGTPAFMPPELATGARCDGRADLYSLGCILYVMGSGRLPFQSSSAHELIALHGSEEPAPPMSGVPPRLAAVVAKLLEKDPARRFQTAGEALDALESSLAAGPVTSAARGELGMRPSTAALMHSDTELVEIETRGPSTAAASSPLTTGPLAPPRRARWPLLVAGAGVLAAGLGVRSVLGAEDTSERPVSPAEPVEEAAVPPLTVESRPIVTPILDAGPANLDAAVEPAVPPAPETTTISPALEPTRPPRAPASGTPATTERTNTTKNTKQEPPARAGQDTSTPAPEGPERSSATSPLPPF